VKCNHANSEIGTSKAFYSEKSTHQLCVSIIKSIRRLSHKL